MKNLRDLFFDELMDTYDAEHQILKALPKMAKTATSKELQEAFQTHLDQTQEQVQKLDKVFEGFETKPKRKKCNGIEGIISENEELISQHKGEPSLDAALIAGAQKVEHYEIASYGCLHEWASLLGNEQEADLLQEILDQEKETNEKLTELASEINDQALSTEGEEETASASRSGGSHQKH